MASLALRKANNQAIMTAIQARQNRQAPALGAAKTYAGVVKVAYPAQQPKPQPPQATTHLPINSQDNIINGANQLDSRNTTTEAEQEANPWITVTRRKQRGLNQKSHPNPKRSRHITLMIEQKRCFKCLERGHTQFQCRNGVTYLNCKGVGHVARLCTTKGPSIKKPKPPISYSQPNTTAPQLNPVLLKSQHHSSPPRKNMDLENWETMPMQDPAEIVLPRAAPMKIFFPPNNDLRSPNTLLHRSAVVLLGAGAHLSQMPHRIANSLAASLGRHPKEFTVSETDPSFGDYLVTFTSNMLRNMACYVGAFMVAPGVQIQLREWTTSLAMVRDPTTHKARIRLHGLPFTYWNFPQVNHLISSFGYAERMSEVVTNQNFKVLQVLVACHDAADIPPSLWLTKNPHSRVVHVELEGWIHNSNTPFYPPNGGDGNDSSSDDTSSDDAPSGNGHYQPASTNAAVRRTNQQQPTRGQGRQAGCGACMGEDRRHRTLIAANTELPMAMDAPVQPVTEMELDNPVQETTGEPDVNHYGQRPGKEIAHEPRRILQRSHKTPSVSRGRKLGITTPLNLTQCEILSIMSRLLPEGKQKGSLPFLFQDKDLEIGVSGEQLASHFQNLSCQVEAYHRTTGVIIEEIDLGLNPSQQAEHMSTGSFHITNSPTAHKDQDGSPPGFAGPPRYKRGVQQAINRERPYLELGNENEVPFKATKQSTRLQAKNTGRYISIVDKARVSQGFIGVTEIMQRPKPKSKHTKPHKPALEYLQDYSPLTKEHAEAVMAAAGVIITPEIQAKMDAAMGMPVIDPGSQAQTEDELPRPAGALPQQCVT